jgi:hypothetical protein
MGKVIAEHRVVLFLHLMKMAAQRRFRFWSRRETLATFAQLGITRPHAQSLVLTLTPDDYVKGPETDRNKPSLEIWVFGLAVRSDEVYVKLQIITDPPEECVCMSFHIAEHPLHYPLRKHRSPGTEESE